MAFRWLFDPDAITQKKQQKNPFEMHHVTYYEFFTAQ